MIRSKKSQLVFFLHLLSCFATLGSDKSNETRISFPPVSGDSRFKSQLEKVNAKAPQSYPEIITPLPERKDVEKTNTATLLKMLESWNPALRAEASKALSERGEEVIDTLKVSLNSENWMVRAGATSALTSILKKSLGGLKGDALLAAQNKYTDITSKFAKLAYDERLEVRVSALEGLDAIAPQTPEAVKAVLYLCDDPDDYLSQDAMVTLRKRFTDQALQQEDVVTAFKAALKRSLPNGKGQIVQIITQMKPEMQRQFVPDLLEFLDWKIMRDTMFGGSGQPEAIKLLTQMKEPQLIKRLPELMGKIKRGDGLFIPCLQAAQAYGKDAKVILPELKAILTDIETNGDKARIRPNGSPDAAIKELKKTIQLLETL